MQDPNPDDPLNKEAAEAFTQNTDAFERQVLSLFTLYDGCSRYSKFLWVPSHLHTYCGGDMKRAVEDQPSANVRQVQHAIVRGTNIGRDYFPACKA